MLNVARVKCGRRRSIPHQNAGARDMEADLVSSSIPKVFGGGKEETFTAARGRYTLRASDRAFILSARPHEDYVRQRGDVMSRLTACVKATILICAGLAGFLSQPNSAAAF